MKTQVSQNDQDHLFYYLITHQLGSVEIEEETIYSSYATDSDDQQTPMAVKKMRNKNDLTKVLVIGYGWVGLDNFGPIMCMRYPTDQFHCVSLIL